MFQNTVEMCNFTSVKTSKSFIILKIDKAHKCKFKTFNYFYFSITIILIIHCPLIFVSFPEISLSNRNNETKMIGVTRKSY